MKHPTREMWFWMLAYAASVGYLSITFFEMLFGPGLDSFILALVNCWFAGRWMATYTGLDDYFSGND